MDENAIKAMLEGTVDEVKEKLGDMSAETLKVLHAAEQAGEKRSTLLAAIDKAAAEKTSGDTSTSGGGDAPADEKVYSQAEFDAAIAERELAWKTDADRRVAAAKGAAVPKAKAAPAPKPMLLAEGSIGPALTALTEGAHVVFVDDRDLPIEGLPSFPFAADAFEPAGDNAVKLKKDVDFPNGLPKGEIAKAFLLGAGDAGAIGVATLVSPVPIGGGRDTRLGAGALMFTKD